ncbi:MAG: SPOR domain-containing protein [Ancalomicrobiaceae bacterium]|nr:SPOR domain-containing protein [Ancalomicrobiaceae bacterium]
MPEPVIRSRPRAEETTRGTAYADGQRLRSPREAEKDPLDELARMVSEAVGSPVRGSDRQMSERTSTTELNTAPRDYPRRDTSWRDPQTPTIVRSSLRPQTMPGQLDDLEAELFSELRGATNDGRGRIEPRMREEDAREAPTQMIQPKRDSRDDYRPIRSSQPEIRTSEPLRERDARQDTGRLDTGRQDSGRQDTGRPFVGRQEAGMDDDVTLPMSSALRQPPQRAPQVPEPAPFVRPDESHYDYDPAGAFASAPVEPYAEPADAYAPSAYGYEDDPPAYPNAEFSAPSRQPMAAPQRSGSSLMTIAAVAVVVIAFGAAAAYGYRTFVSGGTSASQLPVIKADTKPMKEIPPAQPIVATGPNLDTTRSEDPSKLVTRQEDPVDQIPGKTPVRVIGPGGTNPTAVVAPTQKVHTVIVRPDGTIVNPETEAAPPKPPVAPAPVKTTSLGTPDVAPQAPVAANPPVAAPLPPEPPRVVPEKPALAAKPAALAPAPVIQPKPAVVAPKPVVTATAPVSPNAPRLVKPAPQPTTADNGPLQLGPAPGEPTRVASTVPAAAPVAPPHVQTTDAGGADYMVAISSHRSDAEARRALTDLERKFASLGVKNGDVQQAELAGRGTYYRARLAGGNKEQAASLCTQIKAQGVDCWVLKR